MKDIKHIFFDLDHTLYDYNKSAQETLLEIYQLLNIVEIDVSKKEFIDTFYKVNDHLWHLYNHGKIDREYIKKSRFKEILDRIEADASRSEEASHYFLNHCSKKPYLLEDADTALGYLDERYKLHIITNGFTDSQNNKLSSSGIAKYFDVMVTSESIGSKKPSPEIFRHSLKEARADVSNSVMIGDNPRTDIAGAKEIGMFSILYDPSGTRRSLADVSIQSHLELIKLF